MVELPKSIGNLSALELFVVTDNLLNDLPDEMVNMTSLSELKVDGNPFDNLPAAIRGAGGRDTYNFVLKRAAKSTTTRQPTYASLHAHTCTRIRITACAHTQHSWTHSCDGDDDVLQRGNRRAQEAREEDTEEVRGSRTCVSCTKPPQQQQQPADQVTAVGL
jgi:hypothetical protein